MAVHLPNVFLAIVDNISGGAAMHAHEKTLDQISISRAGIFTGANSLSDVQKIMWHEVWRQAQSATHILFIQYDGWVINGDAWDDQWLEYDYIGAPWPWQSDETNVGNGGFSLRSVALMKYLAEHPDEFPVPTNSPEDAVLCQYYRPALEMCGFRWAPLHVAEKFSCERGVWRTGTFGFHGIYNIPRVLPPDEFLAWRAAANDYIRSKPEWKEL